jgi:hypothetical protein
MISDNPYLNPKSWPSRFRRRRFQAFRQMIESVVSEKGRCHILDLGGTDYYWQVQQDALMEFGDKLHIYLVNMDELPGETMPSSQFTLLVGDITKPEIYSTVDFDLIHSNSVIEHVGNWTSIKLLADCIKATGKPYFLQTPNYWFPLEPHFRYVGWQWLPESWRASLLVSKKRGFFAKTTNYEEAMYHVESIKLLTAEQLQILFPEANLKKEWLGPFVKSFMAISTKNSLAHSR